MTPQELNNLPVLGTVVDLVCAIAQNVVGNEIAGQIDGKSATASSLRVLTVSALNNTINEKISHA